MLDEQYFGEVTGGSDQGRCRGHTALTSERACESRCFRCGRPCLWSYQAHTTVCCRTSRCLCSLRLDVGAIAHATRTSPPWRVPTQPSLLSTSRYPPLRHPNPPHPGGSTPGFDSSLGPAIPHPPTRPGPEPMAHTATTWVSGRAAVLFSPMHNSMDKCTAPVKSTGVPASHNQIERMGQPWDNDGENLL